LIFSEALTAPEGTLPDVNQAIQQAWQRRSDLKALESGVKAAEIALSAARAEYFPSASLSGDYGVIGPNPSTMHGVFAATGSVNVPIWQGGRVKGDILQAEATL
jgi:outer membrane protein TolC